MVGEMSEIWLGYGWDMAGIGGKVVGILLEFGWAMVGIGWPADGIWLGMDEQQRGRVALPVARALPSTLGTLANGAKD